LQYPREPRRRLVVLACVAALAGAAVLAGRGTARADETVQLPMGALLDGRPVSTFTGGAVVNWSVGIDLSDGYVTTAVSMHLNQTGPALPDDGTFAANAEHPRVVLHFSNDAAATAPQTHLMTGDATVMIAVPPASYSKIFLFLTSSRGDSPLVVTFSYADGSSSMTTFTLPDWGTGKPLPTAPPIFFNLISGLHKWDAQSMSVDTPTHALTGVALAPTANKTLTKLQLAKMGAMPLLTFWGGTGLATSAIDAGAAPDDGGTAGVGAADAASDATAAGGAAGSGGASGSGGVSGTSGAAGAAGAPGVDAAPNDAPTSTPTGGASGTGGTVPQTTAAGCGCALGDRGAPPTLGWLLALGLALRAWRGRLRATWCASASASARPCDRARTPGPGPRRAARRASR
jgi:hypothetical protein